MTAKPFSSPSSPTGLGTDGTCWTDAEHVEYYRSIARKAESLLRAHLHRGDQG